MNFLRNNWFKLIIGISLLVIAGSVYNYFAVYVPQRDALERDSLANLETAKMNQAKILQDRQAQDAIQTEYRTECVTEEKANLASMEESVKQCHTDQCANSVENGFKDSVGEKYIQQCIYRKNQVLYIPTN